MFELFTLDSVSSTRVFHGEALSLGMFILYNICVKLAFSSESLDRTQYEVLKIQLPGTDNFKAVLQ